MDLQRIKQFIENTGDKFVFIEDGEPSLVVMNFHDYERLLRGGRAVARETRMVPRDYDVVAATLEMERLRSRQEELSAMMDREKPATPKEGHEMRGLEKRSDTIRLEDLPL